MVALAPAVLLGFYFYGIKALIIIALSMLSAVISEWALDRVMGKTPPRSETVRPRWLVWVAGHVCCRSGCLGGPVIIGAFVAIFLGRQVYGGLGGNPFNAVLVGYLVLVLSWPEAVTTYYQPSGLFGMGGNGFKLFASELPVGILGFGSQLNVTDFYSLGAAFIGFVPGRHRIQ